MSRPVPPNSRGALPASRFLPTGWRPTRFLTRPAFKIAAVGLLSCQASIYSANLHFCHAESLDDRESPSNPEFSPLPESDASETDFPETDFPGSDSPESESPKNERKEERRFVAGAPNEVWQRVGRRAKCHGVVSSGLGESLEPAGLSSCALIGSTDVWGFRFELAGRLGFFPDAPSPEDVVVFNPNCRIHAPPHHHS
jgi:hypothetical protein